ncbi:MAG: hypothetical protein AAB036_07250 [Elusimicrobiota bacterium]
MRSALRFLVPAALLGSVLLLGERQAIPPDQVPSAAESLSIAADLERSASCPGSISYSDEIALLSMRLLPSAFPTLIPHHRSPDHRGLSPPRSCCQQPMSA